MTRIYLRFQSLIEAGRRIEEVAFSTLYEPDATPVDPAVGDGGRAEVVLGWSRDPRGPDWRGGEVMGVIAPGPRLVADPPLAGLEANRVPDPSEIPNNHFAYAIQWFLFAATALVIYALAVRKRLAGERPRR